MKSPGSKRYRFNKSRLSMIIFVMEIFKEPALSLEKITRVTLLLLLRILLLHREYIRHRELKTLLYFSPGMQHYQPTKKCWKDFTATFRKKSELPATCPSNTWIYENLRMIFILKISLNCITINTGKYPSICLLLSGRWDTIY